MQKEEIIKILDVVESAGHGVISFSKIDSLPFEAPLAHYGVIFELQILFCGGSKENMINLIEGFYSIGYEILVLDRGLPHPRATLKIAYLRS